MDAFSQLAHGFSVALQPQYLLYGLIGAFLGTAIGVLPGLGKTTTIALLLPLTYSIGDPIGALIMFGGVFYGASYGGSTTAILVNTPGEMRSGWRHQRLSSAGYALGWRVFDYSGHQVVFHAGAVQGYRGLMALVPGQDLGVAMVWNSDSSLPSGLLPTILDRAMGLPGEPWVETPADYDLLLAESPEGAPARERNDAGTSSQRSTASPR